MNGPVGDEPVGGLELVHTFTGPMPTGVTVSHTGRIFVNFPKWGDEVPATVVELRGGQEVPFPDRRWNSPAGNADAEAFVSVQSVVVDPADRLWVLDTGSPMFQPTEPGGPKLVRVDLDTDTVAQVITFPTDVALPTTYLNDVRFDLRRGDGGVAYVTDSSDSGPNGIIVVDLASGASWRRLHEHPSTKAEPLASFRPVVEGRPFLRRPPDGPPAPLAMGSDGIAISADGSRLHYCPLASRRWYSVATDALTDRTLRTPTSPRPWSTRATRAAAPTVWRPTTPAAYTSPPTNTTRCCAAVRRAGTRRSCTTTGCSGRTRCSAPGSTPDRSGCGERRRCAGLHHPSGPGRAPLTLVPGRPTLGRVGRPA